MQQKNHIQIVDCISGQDSETHERESSGLSWLSRSAEIGSHCRSHFVLSLMLSIPSRHNLSGELFTPLYVQNYCV